ncbi:MAG TPA: hypothetical protein VG412_09655 [Acidimicrobiales bacterium]|nr:hypothetical protein [Acidimicrobiales bacterium]
MGRNVVFADAGLHPRAIFGDTQFPEDDDASQFDLDVHAIVELADTGRIAVLNHLGTVRTFEAPWSRRAEPVIGPDLEAAQRLDYLEDVERVIGLGGRLVTSRPRSRRLGGVLVTEPVVSSHQALDAEIDQESFGFVTALAASSTPDGTGWVALGGEGRVRLVEADGGRLGATRWEVAVDFLPAALVAGRTSLWAAGSALGGAGLGDYDWDRLGGGGLAQIELATGAVMASAQFGADLGWGSGGVAVGVADGVPWGVGRCGELYALVPGERVTTQITPGLSPHPLGIAHAAVVGTQLVMGFNRGGYQLHQVPVPTINRLVRDPAARRV